MEQRILSLPRRLIAVAFAGFLAATGCAAAAEPTPKHGGTLEFAVLVEPDNYDCHANISFAVLHPVAPHYSTLLKFDPPNYPQVVGDLAESWTVSPDRRTYTFKLRPNVLFHDGSKLTSADVKASYERIIHRPRASSRRGASIRPRSRASTPPIRSASSSTWIGRKRRCWRISPRPGTASTAPPSSPRIRNTRRRTCWGPGRSSLTSMSRDSIGVAIAGTNTSCRGNPISTGFRR